MKKVRILLRVSSNQQLEADGDLTVQRQLVLDYVNQHTDWKLDEKEYFEGSNSGYKISVEERGTLQEALKDAESKEYDILVCYKDDRIGRRMWEIGAYVMELKHNGVDIFTVKDGCISPQTDDIMGQMVLALRYGTAQKSSSDTGMRVKDTAQKLVQKGKFMGGKAPYGYDLVYSGEISKHGRALKKLVIDEERAKVVKYIYELSVTKEYGSYKIAKELNKHPQYSKMAMNDFWKNTTITSILTNPIYTGRPTYKRREKVDGVYHKLDDKNWIISEIKIDELAIIDDETYEKVRCGRIKRKQAIKQQDINKNATVIRQNTGELYLIDICYCGYCGGKLTNGNKYNYWNIKSTGERKKNIARLYKCTNFWNAVPHKENCLFKADTIEKIVSEQISFYIAELKKNSNILDEINNSRDLDIKDLMNNKKTTETNIKKTKNGIEIMESHIPDAMTGEYVLTVDELVSAIRTHKEKLIEQEHDLDLIEKHIENIRDSTDKTKAVEDLVINWEDVFNNADNSAKRVLVNKIIDKIYIKQNEINIQYKFNLNNL